MNDFNLDDFAEDGAGERSSASRFMGGAGLWLLHVAKILFILYSASHGINAAIGYAGDSVLTTAAQVVGIVTTELVLLALYLAWHNGTITGASQSIVAGAVYVIGFGLAAAAIVGDSQLNAGLALAPWLAIYLRWLLPLAPAVMGAGALLVHSLAPDHLRRMRRLEQERTLDDVRHRADMALERARLDELKTLQAMRLQSRRAVVRSLGELWKTDDAQRAIQRTALANLPGLLRAAGVETDTSALASPPKQEAPPAPFANGARQAGRR